MEPFYRAKLALEKIEPYTDSYGNTRERGDEIAACNFTGVTPQDAMYQLSNHAETLYDWYQSKADEAGTLDEAVPLSLHELGDCLQAMFRHHDEQAARADAEKAIGDVIGAMAKQPAEPATAPFVACKAPDPLNPNFFCGRPIGHDPSCRYVPVEDLPASADDEGDETADPQFSCANCGPIAGGDIYLLNFQSPHGDERCKRCGGGDLTIPRLPDGDEEDLAKAMDDAEMPDEEHPDDELGRASAKLLADTTPQHFYVTEPADLRHGHSAA